MSAEDRRPDPEHAGTLPGLGGAATQAAPPATQASRDGTAPVAHAETIAASADAALAHTAAPVGVAHTLPAPDVPNAETLPGPHRIADLPELQAVSDQSYSIGDEIARGGMGKILSARDRRLGRDVVIKVTRRSAGDLDPRFHREALITAKLQHPSIVRVYEAGLLGDGRAFYAMERVRGDTLEAFAERATSSREKLALLPHAIAVADAIAYAHSQGVIHRDLKPSNVLLGPYGETVVIDWGLAKDLGATDATTTAATSSSSDPSTPSRPATRDSAGSGGSLTQVGAVMGTPSYMAPEQARGDASDELTDVYALGALMYTLLAGVPPYRGRTSDEVLDAVIAGRHVPLAERQPDLPPELATIVERAMARDPRDRYPGAKELADELRRFTTGQLVSAHSYSTWRLVSRWLRRHAIAVGVAAFAVIVLAVVGVLSFRRIVEEREVAEAAQQQSQTERTIAERRKDDLFVSLANDQLEIDPSRAAAWLRELSPGALGWPKTHEVAVEAARRGLARELRGHTGDIERVLVDPTGTRIATSSDDGTVRLWLLPAGTAGPVLRGHVGPLEAIRFSPDGAWLASGGTDGKVGLWRVATGDGRVVAGHEDTVRDLTFSPDGAQVASTSEDGTLWIWDVLTSTGVQLTAHSHGVRPVVWSEAGLFVGALDGSIGRFDPATGKGGFRPAHRAEVRVLAMSRDGTRLASGDETGYMALWTLDGARVASLGRHTDVVRNLAYTADGRRLVSAGGDAIVRVFDVTDRARPKLLTELLGNAAGIKDLDTSPDSAWVASAGIDGTVHVWPIDGGPPRVFRGHGVAVKGVAFTRDGRVVSGAEDDRARIWRLAPDPEPPSGPSLARWLQARSNVEITAPRAPR